jgi:hypothetical protein
VKRLLERPYFKRPNPLSIVVMLQLVLDLDRVPFNGSGFGVLLKPEPNVCNPKFSGKFRNFNFRFSYVGIKIIITMVSVYSVRTTTILNIVLGVKFIADVVAAKKNYLFHIREALEHAEQMFTFGLWTAARFAKKQ